MKSTISDHINQSSNWGEFQPVLQHFIKNKLQGINGGSYLVDYGLKNECLKTIEKGWQIVHRNQNDIIRCTTAMMLFDRQSERHNERTYFDEIIREALADFDRRLPNNTLRADRDLILEPILCDADVSSLQTCLLNILRFLDSLESHSGGGLQVKVTAGNQVLRCQLRSPRKMVEIDDSGKVQATDLSPDLKNVLTVEWLAAKKVLAGHLGKIAFSHNAGVAEFTLELPCPA